MKVRSITFSYPFIQKTYKITYSPLVSYASSSKLKLFHLHLMQLLSMVTIIQQKKIQNFFLAYENMKQMPSKVVHNRPQKNFQYSHLVQNQHKSQFLFHKNCSTRVLCINDFNCNVRLHFFHRREKTAEVGFNHRNYTTASAIYCPN